MDTLCSFVFETQPSLLVELESNTVSPNLLYTSRYSYILCMYVNKFILFLPFQKVIVQCHSLMFSWFYVSRERERESMCAKNVLRPCSKTTFACTAAGFCCPIIDPGQISHCVVGQKTEQFPPWCSGYEGGEKLYIFKVLLLCPNNAVGDTFSGICPMLSLCKHTST